MNTEPNSHKPLYVLAISSYAVHGTASLKTFITILGSKILPVPSLVLSGLTNLPGVKKFELPFEELLDSTLALAVARNLQLIFYTGYLGNPQQADVVAKLINKYREHIKVVITDPVCGDNGRTYVSPEVIARWPEIIKLSDLVFPNITELKLITGHPADAAENADFYIDRFKKMYPKVSLVITSHAVNDHEIGLQFHKGTSVFEAYMPLLPQNFGGSGDLMLALFIRNQFYNEMPLNAALNYAVNQTYQTIKFSIDSQSDGLLLDEKIYNLLP
jgi:pyridoxine kinase